VFHKHKNINLERDIMEGWPLLTAAMFLFLVGSASKALKIFKDFTSNKE
jgi:hypothetical protein